MLLPGIVGAVVGAPLIGRELESGVFRYSWTQGAGRMRWAVAVILPIAVLTAALMGALGLLVAWRNGPMLDAGAAQRLDGSTFPTTGVAVIGWTLLGAQRRGARRTALAPGRSSGCLHLRGLVRTRIPGLDAAAAPADPAHQRGRAAHGSLDIAEHWTKDGARVPVSEVSSVLEKVGVQMSEDGFSAQVEAGSPAPTDPITYLSDHGYIQVHTYQPDSRYWTFQWIELSWLVLVSGLLGLTFWLVRRRSA